MTGKGYGTDRAKSLTQNVISEKCLSASNPSTK